MARAVPVAVDIQMRLIIINSDKKRTKKGVKGRARTRTEGIETEALELKKYKYKY